MHASHDSLFDSKTVIASAGPTILAAAAIQISDIPDPASTNLQEPVEEVEGDVGISLTKDPCGQLTTDSARRARNSAPETLGAAGDYAVRWSPNAAVLPGDLLLIVDGVKTRGRSVEQVRLASFPAGRNASGTFS
jgi:hypothetical protein